MSLPIFDCLFCKCGFIFEENIGRHICNAFPDGMPADVLSGKIRHKNVIQGQAGDYVFNCKEGVPYLERWKQDKK